jgi:hypothetical protein
MGRWPDAQRFLKQLASETTYGLCSSNLYLVSSPSDLAKEAWSVHSADTFKAVSIYSAWEKEGQVKMFQTLSLPLAGISATKPQQVQGVIQQDPPEMLLILRQIFQDSQSSPVVPQ